MSNITINETSFEDLNYQQKIFDLLLESVKINEPAFVLPNTESSNNSPITLNQESFKDVNYLEKIYQIFSQSDLLKPKENPLSLDYSFDRKQIGFYEYYNDNGQKLKKPYYGQMFIVEPDSENNYPFVHVPFIQKLLNRKIFTKFKDLLPNDRYSVVETSGVYLYINTYTSNLYYSVDDEGVQVEFSYESTSVLLTNPNLFECTQSNYNRGPVSLYLEFTSSEDEEIILQDNLTI